MIEPHPITPTPELVQQWLSAFYGSLTTPVESNLHIAACAAQWGADTELKACCELLKQKGVPAWSLLRSHRRPKPPSLKKQALEALDDVSKMSETLYSSYDPPEEIYSDQVDIIRRALEALPDD